MNDMEMAANLYTLEDEDGVEQQFEMLDTLEVDGERYYALVPYYEDPTKELEADAELVVLKAEYDENDEELLSKGGYMPIGKKFWKIYDGIKEVLEPYGIRDAMVSYRQSVENGNNPVAVPDADETEMISLLQGEWICESGSAYIEMYQQDNTFYMDLVHDWHVYSEVRDCYFSPVLELEYRDDWDTELPTEDFSENEVVIDIVRRDGELSYDGVFIADKNGEYLKYQMLEEEDTWYYFYPFKEDVPVEIYIYTNSLVQSIKETVKSEDVQEDSLREAAELLVFRNVISLYPNQCSVTVMDEEVLKIEGIEQKESECFANVWKNKTVRIG